MFDRAKRKKEKNERYKPWTSERSSEAMVNKKRENNAKFILDSVKKHETKIIKSINGEREWNERVIVIEPSRKGIFDLIVIIVTMYRFYY